MNESKQLIDLIAAQTRNLLGDHWAAIFSYRDGTNKIKISFLHTIYYASDEISVKTAIRLSHQFRDEIEGTIDTAQNELPFKETE